MPIAPTRRPRCPRNLRSPRRPAAFTLVELLVVLGIVVLLLAILMPVLGKARRKAAVLASPVAYVAADGMVHLSGPKGGLDVTVRPAAPQQCPACHTPPVWSPSGSTLGFRIQEEGRIFTALFVPFTERFFKREQQAQSFIGWAGEGEWVETDRRHVYVRGERTVEPRAHVPSRFPLSVSPAPAHAPGPYVAALMHQGQSSVAFLRKDFSVARRVWVEPARSGVVTNESPRVDVTGDHVAWTQRRPQGADARQVALKRVGEPPTTPPTLLGLEYESACFCDFTEDGNLLVNAHDGIAWKLVVLDPRGRLLRTLNTAATPAKGISASYRKYMHR